MSFKEYNQDQPFLLPPSLHDFLPEGHLAHVVNEVVDELNLDDLYARYSDIGDTDGEDAGPIRYKRRQTDIWEEEIYDRACVWRHEIQSELW